MIQTSPEREVHESVREDERYSPWGRITFQVAFGDQTKTLAASVSIANSIFSTMIATAGRPLGCRIKG